MGTVLLLRRLLMDHMEEQLSLLAQEYDNLNSSSSKCYYIRMLQTLEFARSYYSCEDIKGVYLENERDAGTARYCVIYVHTPCTYVIH